MSEIGERIFNIGDVYGERCYAKSLKQRREIPWGSLQPGYPEYMAPKRDYISGRIVKPKE